MAELREILTPLTPEQRQELLVAIIARCTFEHQWLVVEEAIKIIKELANPLDKTPVPDKTSQ